MAGIGDRALEELLLQRLCTFLCLSATNFEYVTCCKLPEGALMMFM